ncbi:MAG: 16S rRNA processing protein RimM [Chloroflexi bacterium]|nr:16S rRNA processing protein RimM [Chloroflexota bacterium]
MPNNPPPRGRPPDGGLPDGFLTIARVLRAHGTQGEVACEIVTEFPRRFRQTKRIFLARSDTRGAPLDGPRREYPVVQARIAPHRGHAEVILRLGGVENRDDAETLRGMLVQVPEREAWKLPRGRFYWHQIIGLRVVTTDGRELGIVANILETGANDVYVVKRERGDLLVPAIKQVVKKIDPARGEMRVDLLPGMLEEAGSAE